MQTVITLAQAKQITGGRTPLVPVEYEQAIKALDACITLDEAKYWDNNADALAAWAKIYRSKEAELSAKRLKLHAYRRMGQLAEKLRPPRMRPKTSAGLVQGREPGPLSLLIENGLNNFQATSIRRISAIPEKRFQSFINRANPPSPSELSTQGRGMVSGRRIICSDAWLALSGRSNPQSAVSFRSFCRKHNPVEVAKGINLDEVEKARSLAIELQDWLDAFEQALLKPSKSV